MKTISMLLFGAAVMAGCGGDSGGGPLGAKVTAVETTTQRGSTTTIERTEATYNGDRLRQVMRFLNSQPSGSTTVTYGAVGIEKLELTDKEGDRATTTLQYLKDTRLARTRYEVPGVMTSESTIAYDATRSDHMTEVMRTSTLTGAAPDVALTRYEYDTTGRTSKILTIHGQTTDTTELYWAPTGELERASVFSAGAHVETYTFVYGTDGQIASVSDTHNGRYDVIYDGDGRITETRHLDGAAATITTRYTYGAGSVDGMSFAPAMPMASLFDLAGHGLDMISQLHGAPEVAGDIPRAPTGGGGGGGGGEGGGGGGGGGGGATCGFTPQDACDNCLVASCCSQTQSCLTGTVCDTWIQCATACNGNQTCITSCNEQYPQGYSDFQAFSSCAQAYCPTTCGS